MEEQNKDQNIVLDLDHTDIQQAKEETYLRLQNEAYAKIIDLLKERYEKFNHSADLLKNIYDCRTRNTIMVNGRRGSGKTFFALNIKKYVEHFKKLESDADIFNHFHFIKTIDPTLLHESENFLTIIIAKILNELEVQKCEEKIGEEKKKEFYKKLSAVADSIDGICGVDSCKRSAYEIISQDQSSLRLEQNLHLFLAEVYALLGNKQLILIIDDVDMAFEKGYEVLEVIRKYLNSPYIIPIITGDINLYEMIMQKALGDRLTFQKTALDPFMDNDITKIASDRKVHRIKDLANDYLGKLFEHKSRIAIKNLADFVKDPSGVLIDDDQSKQIKNDNIVLRSKYQGKNEEITLQQFYQILQSAPGITNNEIDKIKEFSLRIFLSFAKEIFCDMYPLRDLKVLDAEFTKLVDAITELSPKYGLELEMDERYFHAGNRYRENEDYDKAIEAYQKAIELNPKHDRAYFNMGNTHSMKEEYDLAIEAYQKAVEINPKHDSAYNNMVNAYFNMGNVYNSKGEYDRAIEAYKKAIEINPKHSRAHNNMGNANAKKREYDRAIEAYQKAIDINPKYDGAYFNMGIAYDDKGAYDLAIEAYQKAVEINPKHSRAHNNMGSAYDKKREYDRAIEAYQKVIEINPKDDTAYFNMGNVYDKKREYDRAIDAYQKAIEINPKHDAAYNNLGSTYDDKGEYDRAIEAYQKAIEINPKHDGAYNNIGIAYNNKGEYDRAIEAYQKAIEINPKYDDAYFNMGIAHGKKGKYDRAIEAHQKAIEINPIDADSYLKIFEISLIKNKKIDQILIHGFESNIEKESSKKIFEMLMILNDKIKKTKTDEVVNRWAKNYQHIDADWNFNHLERWAKGDEKAERWVQIFKENMSR